MLPPPTVAADRHGPVTSSPIGGIGAFGAANKPLKPPPLALSHPTGATQKPALALFTTGAGADGGGGGGGFGGGGSSAAVEAIGDAAVSVHILR